jgi:hypothetical protein
LNRKKFVIFSLLGVSLAFFPLFRDAKSPVELNAEMKLGYENCAMDIKPQDCTGKMQSEMTQGFNYSYKGDILHLKLCHGHKTPGGPQSENTIWTSKLCPAHENY